MSGLSTAGDVRPLSAGPRPLRWRRAGIALLVLVVLAGAVNLFGVRSATARGAGGGYEIEVSYPLVARAGLDVPLRVEVRHAGGFAGAVVLGWDANYLGLFADFTFVPRPSAQTGDGRALYTVLAPPPDGDVLVVAANATIRPSSQRGRDGSVWVAHDGGRLATASWRTWLAP